ncbi:MAG: undecaprenyl/decaprenyl-phosphate alpha-N-acetylglucosaminyl 1-phosphate transferase, partial [Erysipelotrichaceae bacterium]|nr:undecaprenyl/decaprenyl-phosphate alpha-N-acetylglucosaminyl 1-phosphate transferase [Erysipelotrichaceae bacterium]
HMHHILMYRLKLGHRNAVLVLYAVAVLFGLCAILMYRDENIGILLLAFLLIGFELFIESTDMVNPKFHPLIGLSRRIFGWPKKKEKNEE